MIFSSIVTGPISSSFFCGGAGVVPLAFGWCDSSQESRADDWMGTGYGSSIAVGMRASPLSVADPLVMQRGC